MFLFSFCYSKAAIDSGGSGYGAASVSVSDFRSGPGFGSGSTPMLPLNH